jgi:hypothetical protein
VYYPYFLGYARGLLKWICTAWAKIQEAPALAHVIADDVSMEKKLAVESPLWDVTSLS